MPPQGNSTLEESLAFLYSGSDPHQLDVVPGSIDSERFAALTGRVQDFDGLPLAGVRVAFPRHPELGHTFTRADGSYHLVFNGTPYLVVEFTKPGFLPVQRHLSVAWQEWATLEAVTLLAYDPIATPVTFGNPTLQVAQGSLATDADGDRTATVFFPPGVTAKAVHSDGTEIPMTNVTVRATEYTIGPQGPSAMPGELPPQVAYTYAVELSADEVVAMGAESLVFSEPVHFYLENFLGFPVGDTVPMGYYDRKRSAWVPSDSGVVVKILGVNGGLAELDVLGDGIAATSQELANLGFTAEELAELALRYQVDQELWRVPVPHFTPWDCNWARAMPTDSEQPDIEEDPDFEEDDPCLEEGSIIECETQVLRQQIPLPGTGLSLNYSSNRVPGWAPSRTISMRISGDTIPASVLNVVVGVSIAGQRFSWSYLPAPNLQWSFEWDGKDVFGREVVGSHVATVTVGYVYPLDYSGAPRFGFTGTGSRQNISRINASTFTWRKTHRTVLTNHDARTVGLGGWIFDILHHKDAFTEVQYLGNGERRTPKPAVGLYASIPSSNPSDLVVDAGGTAYVSTGGDIYASTAGGSSLVYSHEYVNVQHPGGPVVETRLPAALLAVAPDGRLFFFFESDKRLYWIDLASGDVHWFGGTGQCSYALQEGVHVKQVHLCPLNSMDFSPDGTLYLAERITRKNRLLAVLPDGSTSTVRVDQSQTYPSFAPDVVTVGDDGLYVLSRYNGKVWRLGYDGESLEVLTQQKGWSVPNWEYRQERFQDIEWLNGELYLAKIVQESYGGLGYWRDVGSAVGMVVQDGSFVPVLGEEEAILTGPASEIVEPGPIGAVRHIAQAQGRAIVAAESRSPIRVLTTVARGARGHVDDSGSLRYAFYEGQHEATLDAFTGASLVEFDYDSDGKVSGIIDRYGNVTEIVRSASEVTVQGPDGHGTTLSFNANGYLSKVELPSGSSYLSQHDAEGRLLSLTNPRGASSLYAYNAKGRLVSNQNALGGGRTYSRTTSERSLVVASQAVSGASKTFVLNELSGGGRTRSMTVTGANGATWTTGFSEDDPGLAAQWAYPDGSSVEIAYRPDPRWGMEARFPERTTIRTPSGRSLILRRSMSAVGPDINAPGGTDHLTETFRRGSAAPSTMVRDRVANALTLTSPLGRAVEVEFDQVGAPIKIQQGSLAPVVYEYDSRGRVSASWRALGSQQVRRIDYTYHGGQGPAGHMAGRLESVEVPGSGIFAPNRVTSFQYDTDLRPSAVSLADGSNLSLGYDAMGNATSIQPPAQSAHGFTHTPADQLASYEPPALAGVPDTETNYSYDVDKKLELIALPDGQWIDPVYDSSGFLESVDVLGASTEVEYWPGGRIKRLTSAQGALTTGVLEHHFDGPLALGSTWSGPVRGAVRRDFDSQFRTSSIAVPGGAPIGLQYDGDSLLEAVNHAGGTMLTLRRESQHNYDSSLLTGTTTGVVVTESRYDELGDRISFEATTGAGTMWELAFAYGPDGKLIEQEEVVGGGAPVVTQYGYDPRGRLTEVKVGGTIVGTYTYDANGNRLSMNGSANWTYDAQDRLLSADLPGGTVTYAYSPSGSLTSRTGPSGTTHYSYDVFGNLRAVTLPNGTDIDYEIDPANRRVGKRIDGQFTQGFLYDGSLRIVAELGPNLVPAACTSASECAIDATCSGGVCNLDGQPQSRNEVVSQFVYASRGHVPDLMLKGGVVYRILSDHLGSVRFVIDSATGIVAQALTYDAWGKVLTDTNPGFQPFGFAGGLYDQHTGLTRFGARDYDPEIGRWTAKDPIRFAGGDTNLYAYVAGDPVNFIDPDGLKIVGMDEASKQAIEWLMQHPGLRREMHELEDDERLILVSGLPRSDPRVVKEGGGFVEQSGGMHVIGYNLYTVNRKAEKCGWHEYRTEHAIAHELGHVYGLFYVPGEHKRWAILFENALRPIGQRRSLDHDHCSANACWPKE